MGTVRLREMDINALGTEGKGARRVVAKILQRVFWVIVAIHSCYKVINLFNIIRFFYMNRLNELYWLKIIRTD